MTDEVDRLFEVREEADATLQQLDRTTDRMGPVQVTDDSGQVTVRLDKDGEVTSVRLAFTWRDHLGVQGLAPAILEALTAARAARFESWAHAYSETLEEPTPRARPAARADDLVDVLQSLAGRADRRDPAADALGEVLADIRDGLDEANAALDSHTTSQYPGASPSGRVRAVADGNGEIQSLTFDPAWAAKAHEANLGRESAQAIVAATTNARENGLRAVLAAGKLADLARLATDPTTAHAYFTKGHRA